MLDSYAFNNSRKALDFGEVCFSYYLRAYTTPIPECIEPWFNDLYAELINEKAKECTMLCVARRMRGADVSKKVEISLARLDAMRRSNNFRKMRETRCHDTYDDLCRQLKI